MQLNNLEGAASSCIASSALGSRHIAHPAHSGHLGAADSSRAENPTAECHAQHKLALQAQQVCQHGGCPSLQDTCARLLGQRTTMCIKQHWQQMPIPYLSAERSTPLLPWLRCRSPGFQRPELKLQALLNEQAEPPQILKVLQCVIPTHVYMSPTTRQQAIRGPQPQQCLQSGCLISKHVRVTTPPTITSNWGRHNNSSARRTAAMPSSYRCYGRVP